MWGLLGILLLILLSGIKVINQYERGVILTLPTEVMSGLKKLLK